MSFSLTSNNDERFSRSIRSEAIVIHVNLKRRHLTDPQKVELGQTSKPIFAELAARNQRLKLPNEPLIVDVNKLVALELGLLEKNV
jgi:hypothetical protein